MKQAGINKGGIRVVGKNAPNFNKTNAYLKNICFWIIQTVNFFILEQTLLIWKLFN